MRKNGMSNLFSYKIATFKMNNFETHFMFADFYLSIDNIELSSINKLWILFEVL